MKFYYAGPEAEIHKIFTNGIEANRKGDIRLIVLKNDFLMKKFLFDVYAHEELGQDFYCLFEILQEGIQGPLFATHTSSMFSECYKAAKQQLIEKKFVKTFKTDENYEGMGLISGVFPVENMDKFTAQYKKKILDYMKEVAG